MKLIYVNGCRDCPYARTGGEVGLVKTDDTDRFFCTHPESIDFGPAYIGILDSVYANPVGWTPVWCPLTEKGEGS